MPTQIRPSSPTPPLPFPKHYHPLSCPTPHVLTPRAFITFLMMKRYWRNRANHFESLCIKLTERLDTAVKRIERREKQVRDICAWVAATKSETSYVLDDVVTELEQVWRLENNSVDEKERKKERRRRGTVSDKKSNQKEKKRVKSSSNKRTNVANNGTIPTIEPLVISHEDIEELDLEAMMDPEDKDTFLVAKADAVTPTICASLSKAKEVIHLGDDAVKTRQLSANNVPKKSFIEPLLQPETESARVSFWRERYARAERELERVKQYIKDNEERRNAAESKYNTLFNQAKEMVETIANQADIIASYRDVANELSNTGESGRSHVSELKERVRHLEEELKMSEERSTKKQQENTEALENERKWWSDRCASLEATLKKQRNGGEIAVLLMEERMLMLQTMLDKLARNEQHNESSDAVWFSCPSLDRVEKSFQSLLHYQKELKKRLVGDENAELTKREGVDDIYKLNISDAIFWRRHYSGASLVDLINHTLRRIEYYYAKTKTFLSNYSIFDQNESIERRETALRVEHIHHCLEYLVELTWHLVPSDLKPQDPTDPRIGYMFVLEPPVSKETRRKIYPQVPHFLRLYNMVAVILGTVAESLIKPIPTKAEVTPSLRQ